jgi:hypothetical protein
MNFKIIQGTLTPTEEKDIIKMLTNRIRLAFQSGNEYNIYESRGERREIKIGFFNESKGKKDIKSIIVLFNLLKKVA